MRHLGCALRPLGAEEHHGHATILWEDWRSTFASLLAGEDAAEDVESTDSDDSLEATADRSSLGLFVDAHNTGYYINSYTTKTNPVMDNVLRRLLDGLRRAPDGPPPTADRTARQDFTRVVQLLSRFETSFRRASWKSGCEMAFPMLFGHLSFSTHRCWTVFMRRAVYCAAEAWRRNYGQLATMHVTHLEEKLQFKLPDGTTADLDGWKVENRGGKAIYVSPEGKDYDSLDFVEEAVRLQTTDGSAANAAWEL